MLTVKNLSKSFGKVQALEKINLTIEAGEVFALIGPNGSGKTTLIKIIAGLLFPGQGEIAIGGYRLDKEPTKAKQLIGYIPDNPVVGNYLSGEEFLDFSTALYNFPASEAAADKQRFLKQFGLEGIKDAYFQNYSRGNKQKFAIVAALLHRPKLLLVDEPIVGLDPISAGLAKNLFQEFARAGGAVLLATHTLPVAEEIAGRIGVLKQGKLMAEGSLEELRHLAQLPSAANLEKIYQSLTA